MAKKRRRRDRDTSRAATPQPATDAPSASGNDTFAQPRLPSPIARLAGAVLAVITVGIAIGVASSAFADNRSIFDAATRVVAGVLLVGVAIVLAALSLAPRRVQRMLGGR